MGRFVARHALALCASLGATGCDLIPPSYDNGPIPTGSSTCPTATADGTEAGVVPAEPKGAPAPDPGTTLLAMSKVFYGDTDMSGQLSPIAWRTLGLNLDGKITSECSADVCVRVADASAAMQIDGDNGIDNSFGENVVPLLQAIESTITANADNQLAAGDSTMLLQLDGTGTSPTYAPLPGALLRATPTSSAPLWDGTDVRDVDTASLVGGSLLHPLAVVPGGYMSQRTWVGAPATGAALLDLHISVGNYRMPPVPIQRARVVMTVAGDGSAATQGTLAGIVRTSDAAAWTRQWLLADGSPTLCEASAVNSIVSQIEQTSDIMADGTNTHGSQCDGISIGIGFDATAVKLGQAKTPDTPQPSPTDCDGGS